MPRFLKLLFMFTPLVFCFWGVATLITDLKHPDVTIEPCTFIGRGLAIQDFKKHSTLLFSRSGKPQDDMALQCSDLGQVTVNDVVSLPIKKEETILLTTKAYHYLPTRYHLAVPVNNPLDQVENNPQHI